MTVSNCVIQKTLRRTLDCVSPTINNVVFCIRIVDHLNCIHYHPSLPLKTIISRRKKRKRDPCYHGWPPCRFCGRAFLCEPANRNNLKNNIRGKVFKFYWWFSEKPEDYIHFLAKSNFKFWAPDFGRLLRVTNISCAWWFMNSELWHEKQTNEQTNSQTGGSLESACCPSTVLVNGFPLGVISVSLWSSLPRRRIMFCNLSIKRSTPVISLLPCSQHSIWHLRKSIAQS